MRKYLEFLLLFAPAVLWALSVSLLGDQFSLPNRMILAVLCTGMGGAGLLMQRRAAGLIALLLGIGLLASVPVTHDMPVAAFTLRLGQMKWPQQAAAEQSAVLQDIPDDRALMERKTLASKANQILY